MTARVWIRPESGNEGRRVAINDGSLDWAALRAEYIASGIGQRALAKKYGVSFSALNRRAKAEGWVTLRKAAAGTGEKKTVAPDNERKANDGAIAERVRRKLLTRLEKMADEIPDGPVTEQKAQNDSAVTLFKLRDLTAAFKELAGDLPADGEGRDGVKVIVDV